MLSLFEIAAALLVLSAIFGWINERYIGLPHVIGLLVMALLSSIALLVFDHFLPWLGVQDAVAATLVEIDFYDTMMNGMLAFLLFAGALQVDLGRLRAEAWAVGSMATVGVVISTFVVGFGFYFLAGLFGVDVPLIWALVFGALISPTDPVAVLALLKSVSLPQRVEVKIAGESLFNDGVGIVVFTILLGAAVTGSDFSLGEGARLFAIEAGGGIAIGLVFGWLGYRAMRSMDEYALEVLISLAVVMGGYALCTQLHVSGPLAMAVAGLLIGNHGVTFAMSDVTRDYVIKFWELIDELLNSILFLLIGLEILIISFVPSLAGLAVATIPLVLFARLVAVSAPLSILSLRRTFTRGSIPILTWGGVRGGISVALALAVPASVAREPILMATYAVVIFSIVVQGLTITPLVRRLIREDRPPD